jgi:hypothetical protein
VARSRLQPDDLPILTPIRSGSIPDVDTAVVAQLALDKCREQRSELDSLTMRIVKIESDKAAAAASSGHSGALIVTIVGSVASLIVGIVLWALNYAGTVKADAVKQSTAKVDQQITAAQEPANIAYARGVREGAEAALEKQKREQAEQDLVTVPRNVLKGRAPDKH